MSDTAALKTEKSNEDFSIFKGLTILFMVLNAAFLYIIYATFMGMDFGLLDPRQLQGADAQIMLYVHTMAAFLGGSYIFMINKYYGAALTLAILPQFAFIGALGAVLL